MAWLPYCCRFSTHSFYRYLCNMSAQLKRTRWWCCCCCCYFGADKLHLAWCTSINITLYVAWVACRTRLFAYVQQRLYVCACVGLCMAVKRNNSVFFRFFAAFTLVSMSWYIFAFYIYFLRNPCNRKLVFTVPQRLEYRLFSQFLILVSLWVFFSNDWFLAETLNEIANVILYGL